VTFSGDKLLGGPQAGVIVGTASAVERVKKHPLMRALRPDKLTLAALEATLELYRDGRARTELPALRMLAAGPAELRLRAEAVAAAVGAGEVVEVTSAVGGGALPTANPPSFALALPGPPDALERALRAGDPPVIARIAGDRLLVDVRTVQQAELPTLAQALSAALAKLT